MTERLTRRDLWWLGAIVAAAVTVRLAFLSWEMNAPGFQWSDPDGYLNQAKALTRSGHWHWTPEAIRYRWGGQIWFLPPGYPVFLSIFYHWTTPSPVAAAVAQSILGGLASAAVFLIARLLHTPRAGLIAAMIWALWFPAVSGRATFVQEQLYLPALWGSFAALAWCVANSSAPRAFFWTGLAFGVTTLTRAMPLYYVACLVPLLWWFAWRARRSAAGVGAFAAGFLLLVVPYIAWLSLSLGRLVLIDNHMMILQTEVGDRDSLSTGVSWLVTTVIGQLGTKAEYARGLFQVYGLSWLYHYGGTVSAAGAPWMALFIHLTLDTLFVLAAVLAPLGLVLARGGRVAFVVFTWTLFVISASATLDFTGPRYRAPMEAMLVCSAAVVLAGQWRRPARPFLVAAGATSLLLATIVLPQYVSAWRVSVPYGLNGWTLRDKGIWETFIRGSGGFYVPAVNRTITIEVEPMEEGRYAELLAKLEGVQVQTVSVVSGRQTTLKLPVGDRIVAFVELSPREPAADPKLGYYIRVLR